jgi:hypothetical protein
MSFPTTATTEWRLTTQRRPAKQFAGNTKGYSQKGVSDVIFQKIGSSGQAFLPNIVLIVSPRPPAGPVSWVENQSIITNPALHTIVRCGKNNRAIRRTDCVRPPMSG